VESLLVPADVVAHEVYAQLSAPLMWRFLQEVPRHDDAWAAAVVERLTWLCGEHLQAVWKLRLSTAEAPSLQGCLTADGVTLGDLLRNPDDREERLHAVVLLVARGDDIVVAPDDHTRVGLDDELLLVGWPSARRLLDSTLLIDATREYVLTGRHVPSSWVWRTLSRRSA
jgi:hypothetical protein